MAFHIFLPSKPIPLDDILGNLQNDELDNHRDDAHQHLTAFGDVWRVAYEEMPSLRSHIHRGLPAVTIEGKLVYIELVKKEPTKKSNKIQLTIMTDGKLTFKHEDYYIIIGTYSPLSHS